MNAILNWFSQEEARSLAEALLHSLWQGALLSFVLYVALRLFPSRFANTRYLFSLFTLIGLVLAIFLTAAVLNCDSPHSVLTNQTTPSPPTWGKSIREALRSSSTFLPTTNQAISSVSDFGSRSSLAWQAWFLSLWMLGALAMLVRLSLHVSSAQEIRRRSLPCDNETVTALVNGLQNSLRISRRIGVAVSDSIASPAVLGVLQPTLLLPLSMISGLPVDALRAVLVHELAHIRRWDYLVNLLQMLIEALLFFNPAVWWISRQIRLEREACCDAIAVHHTGDRAKYVEALLCALQLSQPASLQTTLQNLAKESEPSELLERVRRIMQPSFSRKPRMTLLHFSSLLFLCLFLIACMKEGADIAVETASKWFISEEQMQQLIEVEKTYSPLTANAEGKDTKVTVSGTVRTEDGSPLPEDFVIYVESWLKGSNTGGSVQKKDATFTVTIPFGEIYINGYSSGYAPFSYGPYIAEPSGTISNVEVVLTKGHEATLQFTDSQGHPIVNTEVSGYAIHEVENGSNSVGSNYVLKSDEQGKVTIPRIGNLSHRISVSADGYQMDVQTLGLKPNDTFVWILHPARPTTGIVTSKVTGKPISGAELKLVKSKQRQSSMYLGFEGAKVLTITDFEGKFVINTLRSDTVYTFVVDALDHQLGVIPLMRDNQTPIKVKLGPEIVVQGVVTGGVKNLPNNTHITCDNFTLGTYEESFHNHQHIPLVVRDEVGHFEIHHLFPGAVTLRVADQSVEIPVEQSVSNVEIVIPTEPVKLPTRTVVLRLDTPENGALPQGTIKIESFRETPQHSLETDKQLILPIEDGEVHVDIPIDNLVSYQPEFLIGYTFKHLAPTRVEPGLTPMVINIPIIPAGSAFGHVVKEDGTPAKAQIDRVVIKSSPLESQLQGFSTGWIFPMTNPDGSFHLPNLPLAGTYRVLAQSGNNVVISPPFTLTDDKVMQELSLILPNGVDLKGQVVDGQSRPISRLQLELVYDEDSTRTLETKYTGVDGSFVFTNLNPNSEHYFINIPSRRDYQPIKQKVDFSDNPMQIRVEKGRILTGMVLDRYTKFPIPGVKLQAGATDHSHKDFARSIQAEAPTNEKGEFRFSNMAPIEYRFFLQDVNSPYDLTATGGDPNPLTIYATIPEWSSLKPREPEE